MGAAGGSFGGYMVNWIAGHSDRFKALVSARRVVQSREHVRRDRGAVVPDWEYGGPYWDSTAMAAQYRKWSPHLYAKNFKTPTLVTRR